MDDFFDWTHKGWFGICPVYLADIEDDCPIVEPRHWIYEPLFWITDGFFTLCIMLIALMCGDQFDPDEVGYPILITGKLHDCDHGMREIGDDQDQ